MKRYCAAILIISVLFCACGRTSVSKQYKTTYLTLFDTVTTIIGTGGTEAEFQRNAQKIYEV